MKKIRGKRTQLLAWMIAVVMVILPMQVQAYGAADSISGEDEGGAHRTITADGEGHPFTYYFPDEALAGAIAQELGKNSSDNVTQEELNRILSLQITSISLDSLEGIDSLQNCSVLNLHNNRLDRLHDSLFNMKQLEVLSLDSNPISDYELAGFHGRIAELVVVVTIQ